MGRHVVGAELWEISSGMRWFQSVCGIDMMAVLPFPTDAVLSHGKDPS